MTITVTDLFCGAGGSSLGAEAAGMTLKMAANHWETAIEVHQAHFPDAGHDIADISQADPRRYPVTDILLASPECTNHSQARGVSRKAQDASLFDSADLSAERSRATMWDVPRFAEQIRYAAVVVENVVEATKWVMWPAWWQAMELLGYTGRILSHNSQDHGVAQSRDRIYIVWTRDGLQVDLEMERQAHCASCDRLSTVRQAWKNGRTVGRYGPQWVWTCTTCGTQCHPHRHAAAEIIDWTLDCPRIGDRKRPLAEKTRKRIYAGLERHGWASGPKPSPFMFQTAHGGRVSSLGDPHPTVCASDDRQSLVRPPALLMRNNSAKDAGGHMVTSINEPARTLTTAGHQSLLLPYYSSSQVQPASKPIGTQTTRDTYARIDPDKIVDDCGFRMLEPYEVAAAMAFPEGYIPRDKPKRDQVKLAGNAVTPPVMQWICGRIMQALESRP